MRATAFLLVVAACGGDAKKEAKAPPPIIIEDAGPAIPPAPEGPRYACPPRTSFDGVTCAHEPVKCEPDARWNGDKCIPRRLAKVSDADLASKIPEDPLEAAYEVAVRLRQKHDPGHAQAFKTVLKVTASSTNHPIYPESDRAGESQLAILEDEITTRDLAHVKYAGLASEVKKQLDRTMQDARGILERLATIADFKVPLWTAAAIATQGRVLDELRISWAKADPPQVKMFTPEQEKSVARLEPARAGALREQAATAWKEAKEEHLDTLTREAVARDVTALYLARKSGVTHPALTEARERLVRLRDVIGEPKLAAMVNAVGDPNDPDRRNVVYTPKLLQP
jgi:hypothetical protein